jgi:peptidoglycan/LPS O-acetylase OafA/YrhL
MLGMMKHLHSLDGVRGVLAVYVMLGHMAPFAPLANWLQDVVSHGGAAVDVFFVLSGLVITQSLLNADGRAAPFLVARVARIFPVFLAVFAVAVAVAPTSCGFEHMPWIETGGLARAICVKSWPEAWLPEIIAHLTMTHGLFPYMVWPHVWVSFLGSAWSLSTEWQFYVLALLLFRHNGHLCWVLLGLAAAGMAWRLMVPEPLLFSRAFLPNKAHFFALGVASVKLVREERGALWRYGAVLVATMAICSTEGGVGKVMPPLAWTFFLAVQMKPDLIGLQQASAVLCSRIARYLGAISYCVYLVNEPIQKVMGNILAQIANGDSKLFTIFWIPLSIGLPLLAAAWLHAYLEMPALRRGRDIARRLSPQRGAAAVQAAG